MWFIYFVYYFPQTTSHTFQEAYIIELKKLIVDTVKIHCTGWNLYLVSVTLIAQWSIQRNCDYLDQVAASTSVHIWQRLLQDKTMPLYLGVMFVSILYCVLLFHHLLCLLNHHTSKRCHALGINQHKVTSSVLYSQFFNCELQIILFI